jgi:hypothetical protein
MPDIQTALKTALVATAYQPKPLQERLWLWIKDHPGITRVRAQKDLKLSEKEMKNTFHELQVKGQITGEPLPNAKNLPSYRGGKPQHGYRVVGTVWETQPWPPKKAKQKTVPAAWTPAVAPQLPISPVSPPAALKPSANVRWQTDVDRMTIAEARELYLVLHKMFGGRP